MPAQYLQYVAFKYCYDQRRFNLLCFHSISKIAYVMTFTSISFQLILALVYLMSGKCLFKDQSTIAAIKTGTALASIETMFWKHVKSAYLTRSCIHVQIIL